ncbi:MAG: hypothetical protein V1916_00425 [Patescibacteria group bacterium]
MRGTLVIIDGIDGSGKGTLVEALAEHVRTSGGGSRILDLRTYGREQHSLPQPEELKDTDTIVSAEPTFSLIGRAIRDEIVRHNNREYSALTTAQAFALDRYILYKRVILPALGMGKTVFQERGVTTSICYQPIQKEALSVTKILALEGNQLAMQHRPDLLILVKIKPEVAVQRLQARSGKQDQAIFERLDFFRQAQRRFVAPWFRKFFVKAGSRVEYVDTNVPQAQSEKQVIDIWEAFINR